MSDMATIYDVAERAGVSISTVSLVLNAPSRVRAGTLERVMAAIDELGFVPKTEAVTRARRGTGRIGVMAPFTSYPSFARRLNGVMRALRAQPWEIVVYDQQSAADSSLVLASMPLRRRLDGLIIMSLPFDNRVAHRLNGQDLVTVLVELVRPGFSSVTIDDAAGGRMVAELFLARGHTTFGFIGEAQRSRDYVSQSMSRLNGFRDGLAAAGRRLTKSQVRLVPHSMDAARQAAGSLLELRNRPTAIFAHDDILASGVIKAAREKSLSVPDDLAVVGFDDSDIAEHIGLTSVGQPFEESGEVAVLTLLTQLRHSGRSLQHITLKLSLVERETT
jgi:DNA-binding LacI/PurR family transcriptional regulator